MHSQSGPVKFQAAGLENRFSLKSQCAFFRTQGEGGGGSFPSFTLRPQYGIRRCWRDVRTQFQSAVHEPENVTGCLPDWSICWRSIESNAQTENEIRSLLVATSLASRCPASSWLHLRRDRQEAGNQSPTCSPARQRPLEARRSH